MKFLKYALICLIFTSNNAVGQNIEEEQISKISIKEKNLKKTKNYLKIANRKFKRKKYEKAYSLAKKAFSYCNETLSLNLSAVILAKQKKRKLANIYFEKASEKAIENGINRDTIFTNWAQLDLENNQFPEAIDKLNQISDIENNPDLLYYRGTANLHLNRVEEAIIDLKKADDMGSNQDIAYNLGLAFYSIEEFEKAKEYFVKSKIKGKSDLEIYLALANSCEKLKQSEEALTFFKMAYHKDKMNIDAILGVGNINYKLGKYKNAKKFFNKVLDLEPNSYDANYGLGICETSFKNYEIAKSYFEKSININPDRSAAYVGNGNINCHFGKYREAIVDYDISISLNSENPCAYEGRGIAYFRLNQHYNAIESFKIIEAIDQNYTFSYDAHISKGFANYNIGNFKEAKKDFEESIILEPKKASGHNGLGCTNYKLNDYWTSIQNFNIAIEFTPNDDVILTNRGNALYKVQDYTNAINDFNKAVLINPTNEHAYNGLGICNHRNDNYEDAIQYIQKAIDISPSNEDLYMNLGISRGLLVKELRKSKKDTLASEQYLLMLQDHEKSVMYGLDSSAMRINLGYLHFEFEEFEAANDYYNSVNHFYYNVFAKNNKGVVLISQKGEKYKNEAYTLFEEAIKEDDESIKLYENHEKYEAPRFNKNLIGKDAYSGNVEKYISTYFYHVLMRYSPPPTEHNFPIEINLRMPNPSPPNINYILYEDVMPCYKVKIKKVKTKRAKNKKGGKESLPDCSINY